MSKTDIYTDNSNNLLINNSNDIALYTSNNVNILALRNKINELKPFLLLEQEPLDFNIVNTYVINEAIKLNLNPQEIIFNESEYKKGVIKIDYKIKASEDDS